MNAVDNYSVHVSVHRCTWTCFYLLEKILFLKIQFNKTVLQDHQTSFTVKRYIFLKNNVILIT